MPEGKGSTCPPSDEKSGVHRTQQPLKPALAKQGGERRVPQLRLDFLIVSIRKCLPRLFQLPPYGPLIVSWHLMAYQTNQTTQMQRLKTNMYM